MPDGGGPLSPRTTKTMTLLEDLFGDCFSVPSKMFCRSHIKEWNNNLRRAEMPSLGVYMEKTCLVHVEMIKVRAILDLPMSCGSSTSMQRDFACSLRKLYLKGNIPLRHKGGIVVCLVRGEGLIAKRMSKMLSDGGDNDLRFQDDNRNVCQKVFRIF